MIGFFTQQTDFSFRRRQFVRRWYKLTAGAEVKRLGDINVIFCSDPYILDVNVKYLGHDYYTDIITFDYCEGERLSGDLFISVDCVRENASFYGVPFEDELDRVMIHGLLHLVGYDDRTEEQQKQMREKENYYLSLREKLK